MITLNESTLETHVRAAVSQLVEGADKLRSLADLLEELGGTQGNAEPVDLRRAVVGIQSAAMQALLTAATAVGLGDRIRTIAELKEAADG
ncbi:MAG: hypothetical protein ACOY0T_09450 [Myxococcota bacterium]